MKKYLKFIITFVLVLFVFNLNVNADICDDTSKFSKKNAGSRYCYSPSLRYNYSKVDNTWTSSHISSIYSASNTYSGRMEYPLCLDPGLYDPIGSNKKAYNYFRNLDLSLPCDKDFYKVYQYYVNDVAAAKTTLNETYYLEQANVALRVFAIQNGCDIKYLKNALNNQFHNNIYPYMIGGNSSIGDISGWGTKEQLKVLKKHYERVRDGGFLWNNPLRITPSWEYDNENNKYVFNFEIKFTNETSQYFDSGDSNLYSGDYDIGDGHAVFGYTLLINNGAYSIDGNTLSGTNGNGCISAYDTSCTTSNPNSTRNIKLEMSKDTYDSIVRQSGKVTISLNYNTYHPMAEDNVILNYIGESDMTEYKYQRMVVFSKVYKNGTINADGSLSENVNYCRQEGNKFYYGNSEVNLETYKAKCRCSNINSDSLTNNNLKEIYSNLCPTVSSSTYSSTLSDCNNETDMGKNTLIHSTKNSLNTYCTLSCDETVDVNNMVGNFSTEAGKTFKFEKYPSLTANKECRVSVNYSDWYDNYYDGNGNGLLEQEIRFYNEYVRSEAINKAKKNPSSESCSCGEDCTIDRNAYYASYPVYYLRGNLILSETKNDFWGGCRGTSAPSTISNAYSKFIDNYDKLMNHFKQLKTCNSYLNKLGSNDMKDDQTFYNFGANLKFYYEQTISDKSNGQYKAKVVRNDSKENNVDDSSFSSISSKIDSSGNYVDYDVNDSNANQYVYISSNEDVNSKYNTGKIGASNDYEIIRRVKYKYDYSPNVPKYVDTYTNIISSNYNNLQNPVYLGDVYDTDVAALAKKDNKTLYVFTSVGEEDSKTSDTKSIYETLKNNETNGVKRTCTYEITNDIIDCNDSSCTTSPGIKDGDVVNPYSNIAFRIVDPNNIDPNNRLGNEGFKNWNNEKGKTVKKAIEDGDTFNPNNLEYSFTLDSATIQSIRKYNENKSYSNVDSEKIDGVNSLLECENGTKCLSSFITAASDGNTVLFDKKFALNTNGRATWKVYENKDGKNYIDGEEIKNK